jgi:hypothetical protein
MLFSDPQHGAMWNSGSILSVNVLYYSPTFVARVASPISKRVVGTPASNPLVAANLAAFHAPIQQPVTDHIVFPCALTICHEDHLFLLSP